MVWEYTYNRKKVFCLECDKCKEEVLILFKDKYDGTEYCKCCRPAFKNQNNFLIISDKEINKGVFENA